MNVCMYVCMYVCDAYTLFVVHAVCMRCILGI